MLKFTDKSQKIELKAPAFKVKPSDPKVLKKANAALGKGVLKGSTYVEQSLRVALNSALEASVWGGFTPRAPYTSPGGQLRTTGVRNITDTGRLKKSLKLTTKYSQTKAIVNIAYTAPYAALVHYGGAIQPWGNPNASTVTLPGRPWVTATLNGTNGIEKVDLKTPFLRGVNEALNAAGF